MPNARRRAPAGDVGRWLPYLAVAPAFGVLGIGLYARSVDSGAVFAVGLLVAGAAFLSGALLGFLFGIPRLLATEGAPAAPSTTDTAGAATEPQRSPYRTNTNLEQISDWLTKILVGVGLVELGKLTRATKSLVDYLAPALGGKASSPAVALAVLFVYTISGFLIVYLVTRVYLGRVFAQADELMQRIDEVEAAQLQQQRDVEALTAVARQIDADPADSPPTQDDLDKAVAAASAPVRTQIFNAARERRKYGRPEQKARTAGIFRALIAADTAEAYHRNHAQLAYTLFDPPSRDYAAAEAALSTAIERRDQRRQHGGYHVYEYMRARCRIETDPSPEGEPSDPGRSAQILADLRYAAQSQGIRNDMKKDAKIQSWLRRNDVADVALQPGG